MYRMSNGISEVVSAMIMLLIVVIFGVALYLNLTYTTALNQQIIERQLLEEEIRTREVISVLLVLGYSNETVNIVVAVGSYPTSILSIYVNGTLAQLPEDMPETLEPFRVYEIRGIIVDIPMEANDTIYVRVVYGGGYVDVWGKVSQA